MISVYLLLDFIADGKAIPVGRCLAIVYSS